MEHPVRMLVVGGVLMLALLVAVLGSVGAGSLNWEPGVANIPAPTATGEL
jgi:hypothetical protein